MFEENTYENIINRVLARIDDSLDKREGSVIFSAVAPVCAELVQAYIALGYLIDCTFADTAPREFLVRRALERGLIPTKATYTKAVALFNIDVDIGKRFSSLKFNWAVSEKISTGKFYIICETAGSLPNAERGNLIPIEYIDGLETASIESIEVYGEDEEDTEEFRKRYFSSFESQAFGGNKRDYYQKVTAIDGVGGCKIFRATDSKGLKAPGHVLAIITNSEYGPASETLVSNVQRTVDPNGDQMGDGLAPIGHICHIESVKAKSINIDTNIVYDAGYSFSALQSQINKAIDGYLYELNKSWDTVENVVVRISNIESRILAINGIKDIADTNLNGSPSNVILDKDTIAVRGTFNG